MNSDNYYLLQDSQQLLNLIKNSFNLLGNNIIIFDFLEERYNMQQKLIEIENNIINFNIKNDLDKDSIIKNSKYIYSLLKE